MEERKLRITDTPALAVTFSIILIIASLGLSYTAANDIVNSDDLIKITGTVKKFKTYIPRQGGRLMEISMMSKGIWYKITQKDLTWKYPKLKNISSGDFITVHVTNECCASNLKQLWSLQANGNVILPYKGVVQYKQKVNTNLIALSKYLFITGIILSFISIVLRYKFGKWSS